MPPTFRQGHLLSLAAAGLGTALADAAPAGPCRRGLSIRAP